MIRVIIASAAVVFSASIASAQSLVTEMRPAVRRAVVERTPSVEDHLALARVAASSGDFDAARREYLTAVNLERTFGRLPVESTRGLVQMLYALSYNREASYMLDQLADEAQRRGDVDTEARARADAMWLKADDGRRDQARIDARRLKALTRQGVLSDETKAYVAMRLR